MQTTHDSRFHGCCTADSRRHKQTYVSVPSAFRLLASAGFALSAALSGCAKEAPKDRAAPPDVVVASVIQQDVPVYAELVCQLNGPVNADITPKVQGYLLQQNYQNGFFVKKGQLLFTLDSRQYEASVAKAKAQLGAAEATLAKYDADVARDTPLAAERAIAQKDLDTDLANQQASRSDVQAQKASLANAELNLAWTKVYSPIDGIAGVSNAQVGDLVGTGTKMTTVSQVNPIWAYFNISESAYLRVAPQISAFITGRVGKAATPTVELIMANNEPYPQKGRLIYVNRQIATQTGTIQMAAEFTNPQAMLRPGGYGRIRLKTGNNESALLVPQPAVIEVQSEYQVIVVTPDNRAMFRPVKVGDRIGPNWIISDGLKPGERVVVEGIQKIQMFAAEAPQLAKEGIPVSPRDRVAAAGGSD